MLESFRFTLNAHAGARTELLEGREHWVVPMVMMTEGVWNGSHGSMLYRAEELSKSSSRWNHKPIVVYHPTTTAADPAILNTRKIGVVLRTRWDGKQRAEAWIDKQRAAAVDARVVQAILNREKMEVSTGLFVDRKDVPENTFNGRSYAAEAVNHSPDHLAILPDQLGACSIADGAGLFQLNRRKLKRARIRERIVATLRHNAIRNANMNELGPDDGLDLPVMNFDDQAREMGLVPDSEAYPQPEVDPSDPLGGGLDLPVMDFSDRGIGEPNTRARQNSGAGAVQNRGASPQTRRQPVANDYGEPTEGLDTPGLMEF